MSVHPIFAAALAVTSLALPRAGQAQSVTDPVIRSTVPARFEPGDTLAVSFRYQVPASVGQARVRILLLSRKEAVGTIRSVRPEVAEGSGVGEALEVFREPVVVDGIRIVLSGPADFLQVTELPLGVGAGSSAGALRRPGWIDPGELGPPSGGDPNGPPRILAAVVDADLTMAALARAPLDTLTTQEAVRFSPQALKVLTERLSRPLVRPSSLDLLRRTQAEALTDAARRANVSAGAVRPVAPPAAPLPATPDTVDAPGRWTIEPDGSMHRTYPDGTVVIIDAAGNESTCTPVPGSDEMRCLSLRFSQIPRVIPSSELATIDVAWLESMDAWIEKLADDALQEMRTLVDNDESIEAYLGLEEDKNLYQRLDQRLDFLSRLLN